MNSLGLDIHLTKGYHTTTQVGKHFGMEMSFAKGVFRASVKKLREISVFAKTLRCTTAANKRWVPAKALVSLARKSQFVHLAIQVARLYLREYHDVVSLSGSWSGTVRLSK